MSWTREFLKPMHEIMHMVENLGGTYAKDYLHMHTRVFLDNGMKQQAAYCALVALGIQVSKKYSLSVDRKEQTVMELFKEMMDKAEHMAGNPSEPEKVKHEDQHYLTEMVNEIKQLPKEWTVVQINKQFDNRTFTLENKEVLASNCGFWVTMVRYPRCEINKYQPIILRIPPLEEKDADTYRKFLDLVGKLKHILEYDRDKDTKQDRIEYWKKYDAYTKEMEACVAEQKQKVAPWIFLLTGNYDPADRVCRRHEAKVYARVDEYCKTKKCTTEYQVLLSLVGRNAHQLTPEHIFEYCTYFEEDDDKLVTIMELLLTIKLEVEFTQEPKQMMQPCLFIVDEHLDFLFWEMYYVRQPITRISSFVILMSLHKKYAKSIKGGYLEVDVSNGLAVVNPENNLPQMALRVTELLDHCLPHWERIAHTKPDTNELLSSLKEKNVFMFFGHGSGLQFLKGSSFTFVSLKCITFLFGCASVNLGHAGGIHEMPGPHMYYHVAQSPLVFGFLISVTDFPTDCMASIICERWLKVKDFWKKADRKHWKSRANYDQFLLENTTPERNLLKIVQEMRQYEGKLVPPMQKMAICLRGIPIKAKE